MHRSLVRFAVASAFAAALSFSACASPGEGDRCDTNDEGGGDCGSGLVCTPAPQLNGVFACCPPQGTSPTTSICGGTSGGGGGADASLPPDDGGDAAADAPSGDAGPDGAAADAGNDAAVDAADDGG